jgi:hypothetical protein
VRVGGLDRDPDRGTEGGGSFEEREEVRGQHHVADVVYGHVPVDAVVCELVGHDAAGGVQDQDVEAVGLRGDLLGGFGDGGPVGEVRKFDEGDFARDLAVELVGDVFQGRRS